MSMYKTLTFVHQFGHSSARDVIITTYFKARVLEAFLETFSVYVRALALHLPRGLVEGFVVEDEEHSPSSVIKVVLVRL